MIVQYNTTTVKGLKNKEKLYYDFSPHEFVQWGSDQTQMHYFAYLS